MKPLLIIYFSGVGNTKTIAGIIKSYADKKIPTEIYSVKKSRITLIYVFVCGKIII